MVIERIEILSIFKVKILFVFFYDILIFKQIMSMQNIKIKKSSSHLKITIDIVKDNKYYYLYNLIYLI